MPFRMRPADGLPYTVVALLLVTLLLQGCSASGEKSGTAANAPPIVSVMEVQPRDVPIFSDFAAQTYARNMVEVRGRVEGYIEQWLFQPGAEVKAGQVLYVLDLRPYEAAWSRRAGNLRQTEADLDFARKQVSLLQAQANLASAEANLVKAQQDYDRLKPLVQADAASKQDLMPPSPRLRASRGDREGEQGQRRTDHALHPHADRFHEAKVEAQQGALHTAELNLHTAPFARPSAAASATPWCRSAGW